MKNTFDGEKRSLSVRIAKTKVPIIKPNCTDELIYPSDSVLKLKNKTKSLIIEFPANHNDVQQN